MASALLIEHPSSREGSAMIEELSRTAKYRHSLTFASAELREYFTLAKSAPRKWRSGYYRIKKLSVGRFLFPIREKAFSRPTLSRPAGLGAMPGASTCKDRRIHDRRTGFSQKHISLGLAC